MSKSSVYKAGYQKRQQNLAKRNEEKKALSDKEIDAILSGIEGKPDKVILAILAESSAKVLEKYLFSTQKTLDNIMSMAGEGKDSLLHLAAKNGNQSVFNYLVTNNVNLELKNKYGETPLHSAISARSFEVAELLINKEADVNARDNEGKTPLHIAAADKESGNESLKLLVKLRDEDEDLIVNLQAEDGGGKTPLDYAIESKNTNSVQLLIDAYPNMNSEEKEAILAKVSENRSEEKSAIPIPQAQEVPAAAVAYTVPKVEEVESNLEYKHAFSAAMTKKYMWTNTGVKKKAREIIEAIKANNLTSLSEQEKQGKTLTELLKGLGGLRKTDKEMLAEITEQFKSYAKNPSKQITLPSRYNLPSFGKKSDKGQTKQ